MRICITLIFGLFSLLAFADEDVVRFYQRVEPEKKVLALSLGNADEVSRKLIEEDLLASNPEAYEPIGCNIKVGG